MYRFAGSVDAISVIKVGIDFGIVNQLFNYWPIKWSINTHAYVYFVCTIKLP